MKNLFHCVDQLSDNEEGPAYLLEHLATFTVGKNNSKSGMSNCSVFGWCSGGDR